MEREPDTKLEVLFERCLQLEGGARERLLASVRGRDAALALELDSLLAAHARNPSFLGSRAPPIAPRLSLLLEALARGERDELPAALARLSDELDARGRPAERYELRGELGAGGMGEVLRAFDPDLEREVALKRLHALERRPSGRAPATASRTLGLFLREARVTAALDHPGVVPVHELGLDAEGRVYFTMRLVEGRELGEVFALARAGAEGWNVARALEALLKVCDALSYAHDRGVVHRDLKPRNVLVGRYGEVYVMDWGVARLAGGAETFDLRPRADAAPGDPALATLDGTVLGTPAYMSPEQARGEVERIDARSDVYALGATLYELLAGHPPYAEPGTRSSARELLGRVLAGPPADVGERAPAHPPELHAICAKAMEREQGRRYQSVAELSAELRAFLDGRVVRAYESGALAELRKWVRRNRGTALASATALLALLGGLGGTALVQARARAAATESGQALAALNLELEQRNLALVEERERAQENAAEAERQRGSAERVVDFLVELFRSPDPEVAQGKDPSARELLERGATKLATDRDLEPLQRARLAEAMGRAFQGLDDFGRAAELLGESQAIVEREHGTESLDALYARNLLALLQQARGNIEGAAEGFELALAIARRTLDPLHPLRLELLQNLGYLRAGQGRYGEALAHYQESLAGKVAAFGERDFRTLVTRHTLGILYTEIGRPEEAERELALVLAERREQLGPDHPHAINALETYATLLQARGRAAQAQELLREVLSRRERVFGPSHSATLSAMSNLANALFTLGRTADAIELHERTLEERRALLGEEHIRTLESRLNLAVAYGQAGRQRETLDLCAQALADAERLLGPDHPRTLLALATLAGTAGELRLPEAAQLMEDALERHRAVFGPGHPSTLTLLNNHGRILLLFAGRPREAIAPLEEALAGLRSVDASHPSSLTTQELLVAALVRAQEWGRAGPLARDLLARLSPQSPMRQRTEAALLAIEQAMGSLPAAPGDGEGR